MDCWRPMRPGAASDRGRVTRQTRQVCVPPTPTPRESGAPAAMIPGASVCLCARTDVWVHVCYSCRCVPVGVGAVQAIHEKHRNSNGRAIKRTMSAQSERSMILYRSEWVLLCLEGTSVLLGRQLLEVAEQTRVNLISPESISRCHLTRSTRRSRTSTIVVLEIRWPNHYLVG